ncbi:MAG: ATP-binding cassette domain-containing protein, partial [Bacteroidia bacterium]|nr:ATP-binding cassette domain-containing protein [Bacteroidia bacterium]
MKGICKNFGGVRALDTVDFEIYYNEILALVGDNGAGKSTLAKIISGTHTPDAGEIFFEGRKVQINNPREARRFGIEMIYQDLALFDLLDVSTNLFMGRELYLDNILGKRFSFIDNKKMYKRSFQILKELKIDIESSRRRVAGLSGGQRQAVAICRGILWGKKLIIMDEPTAALGVREANEVLKLIKNLKEKGLSILVISHNLQHIFSIA